MSEFMYCKFMHNEMMDDIMFLFLSLSVYKVFFFHIIEREKDKDMCVIMKKLLSFNIKT